MKPEAMWSAACDQNPKGQGEVAAVISTEMGNYYWSYCGVAITHVKGSCLVVYMCVSACSNDCTFTQIYL